MTSFVVFAATAGVAAVGVPLARRVSVRSGWLDAATSRSSHVGVVPRCGGLGVAAAVLIVLVGVGLVWSRGAAAIDDLIPVVGAATVLAALGFVDDVRGLGATIRLSVQVVVAGSLVIAVFDVDVRWSGAMLAIVGAAAAVAYVNAFNFMDGINGISAAQAVVAGLFFAALGQLRDIDALAVGGALLAGSFVGFLPFNAPRARVFLGDVGSYFAGSWIVGLVALAIAGGVAVPIALAPTLLYLADTGSTIVIRLRRGEDVFEAHRDHAYQRLSRRWRSHGAVAFLAAGVMAVSSGAALAVHDATRAAAWSVAVTGAGLGTVFVVLGRTAREPELRGTT